MILLERIVLLGMSIIGIVQGVYLISRPEFFADYDKVGPGRSLIVVSLLLMITVIIHIMRHGNNLHKEKQEPGIQGATTRLWYSMGILVIYITLLHIIGFLPATFIFFFLMFRFFGVRSWLKNTFLSTVFSISIYVIFVIALNTELPRGLFLD
jgi:putative tricarboxylic transport membrane protein